MKKIWKFLVENFDTIVAIIVSVFAAVYGVFGGNQIALLAGIATVLGLLAFGIIRDRFARDSLEQNIQHLNESIKALSAGKTKAELFFVNREKSPSLPEFLRSGSASLDILGSSLISIGTVHHAILRELKDNGEKVRVIVTNPENAALQEFVAKRYKEIKNPAMMKTHTETTLKSLVPLLGRSKKGGSLDIRITDFVPGFSYIGIDVTKPTGKIQVEFVLNQIGLGRNPIFFLDSTRDAYWFSEFNQQFEFFWKNGTEIDMSLYQ